MNQLPDSASAWSTRPWLTSILWGVLALVVFVLTCYPTVTWWDSASYTGAALALGVPAPPGSLMAVLIGWLVSRLAPISYAAKALNLTAALVAAVAVVVFSIAVRHLIALARVGEAESDTGDQRARTLAVGVAALTLAFGETLWIHATKFTPYILTACMTATILWALVRWWQSAATSHGLRWLLLIALLIGLDFSIHRTNALLIPGIFVWVLVGRPAIAKSLKVWVGTAAALALGLSFHLITIALAARSPQVNFNDPNTLGRFWDYLSLQMHGGGWLFSLYPRNAAFWSYQVPDFLKVFAANFFTLSGPYSVLGLLPGVFGLLGIVVMLRRRARLALALLLLVLVTAATTIIYFNIPANFFRPFDRHYLPTLILFAAFIAYGLYVFLSMLRSLKPWQAWPTYVAAGVLMLALPGNQLARNYRALDSHRNYFAYDFGRNLLATLPANAIVFTFGDSDTFLPWYCQIGENLRPDVAVVNVPLLNTDWYVEQLNRGATLPLTLTSEESANIGPRRWSDTTFAVPVETRPDVFALPDTTAPGDTTYLQVVPQRDGGVMLAQDWLVLRIVRENRFRRPIYFSMGGYSYLPPWLQNRVRVEGLACRLMPVIDPPLNRRILGDNVLNQYSYRGYNDSSMVIDATTQSMVDMYRQGFVQLVQAARQECSADSLRLLQARIGELIPRERLTDVDERSQQMVEAIFGE